MQHKARPGPPARQLHVGTAIFNTRERVVSQFSGLPTEAFRALAVASCVAEPGVSRWNCGMGGALGWGPCELQQENSTSCCSLLCSCFLSPIPLPTGFSLLTTLSPSALPRSSRARASWQRPPRAAPPARCGAAVSVMPDTCPGGAGHRPPAPPAQVTRQMGAVGHWSAAKEREMKGSLAP